MVTPPTIELANLGMADSLILMVLALVVFGPRRLPQIGRQIGKLMYEFRKASNDFKFQMEEELRNADEADRRKKEEEERQRALAAAPPPALLEATAGTTATETPAAETAEASTSTEIVDTYTRGYPATGYGQPDSPAPQPEETYPRIQPPSTGEPVAAERPGAPLANTVADPVAPAETDAPPQSHPSHPDQGFELSAAPDPVAQKPKVRKPRAKKVKVEDIKPETEPAAHNG